MRYLLAGMAVTKRKIGRIDDLLHGKLLHDFRGVGVGHLIAVADQSLRPDDVVEHGDAWNACIKRFALQPPESVTIREAPRVSARLSR